MDLSWVEETKSQDITLATVIEVKEGVGVKIQIEGESAPREVYYNSYVKVNSGDRVGVKSVSGTLIIEGKLQY